MQGVSKKKTVSTTYSGTKGCIFEDALEIHRFFPSVYLHIAY